MEGFIQYILDSVSGIGSDFFQSGAAKDIVRSPKDVFGAELWDYLLRICSTAIMPISLTLLCFFMASEFYSVWCKQNGEVDLQVVTATAFKMVVPFLFLTKSYDFLQIIFTLFNKITLQISEAVLTSSGPGGTDLNPFMEQVHNMTFFDQMGLVLELLPALLISWAVSLVVMVIVYGRLFEISLYWLISPIPLATLIHSEFSQIGKNFIKMFAALLLQGSLMLLCLVLYSFLLQAVLGQQDPSSAGSILATILLILGYALVLAFSLVKTGGMSKRILGTF